MSSPSPWMCAIDFGTSNSLVTVASREKVENPLIVDPAGEDPTVMRSVLYTRGKQFGWNFGTEAIEQYTEWAPEGRLLRSLKKHLPDSSFLGTQIEGVSYTIIDLIAVFLRHFRQLACTHCDADVSRVVLGRPAIFSTNPEEDKLAEQRLTAAAQMAGFTEVHFLAEPLAAAYEFRRSLSSKKKVLIADFGGGTSDFTVLELGPDRFRKEDVLAIGGVSRAGDAIDGSLMQHKISRHFGSEVTYQHPLGRNSLHMPRSLLKKLCSPADIAFLAQRESLSFFQDVERWAPLPEDKKSVQQLMVLVEERLGYPIFRAIEDTKKALSQTDTHLFCFEYPGIDIAESVSQSEFFQASTTVVEEIFSACDATMQQAQLQFSDIDIVCCTGGTAKYPAVIKELANRFGAEKLSAYQHFHSIIRGLGDRAQALLLE